MNESKKVTEDIILKLKAAKVTEERIDENRANYYPVAHSASILYFCIESLHTIDPMYQYSMKWFRGK
jgi:dynein heavy chain